MERDEKTGKFLLDSIPLFDEMGTELTGVDRKKKGPKFGLVLPNKRGLAVWKSLERGLGHSEWISLAVTIQRYETYLQGLPQRSSDPSLVKFDSEFDRIKTFSQGENSDQMKEQLKADLKWHWLRLVGDRFLDPEI